MTDEIDELVDRIIGRSSPTLDRIIRERDELRVEVERLRGFLKHLVGEAQDRDDLAQMDEIFAALANR